ncbi:MAG: tetratricopeptide repeat protein [Candidatus Sulfotelmatobacter sp.]
MNRVSVTPSNGDWTKTDKQSILAATLQRGIWKERTMGGDSAQPQPTVRDRPANDRLDSWKEIAAYLKKEVRTVQRWEKRLGLPVRRLVQGKQGTVFAYKSDLDSWWRESQSKIEDEEDKSDAGADSSGSNVVVLAHAVDQSDKTEKPDTQPDRLRRLAVLVLLVILGTAIPLSVFWPQIRNKIWPPVPKMTLAVRPFKNMSGDPGQDFVADGLTEEMITWLGQLHPDEMGVIRLSPAYALSDLDRIGKDVHANYVLEGGVRVSGQRVAITAQLFQVSDHTLVWGEAYERDLQDVLRIQAEVAGAIASGVLNKLPHAQPPIRQVNREAYLAYLQGRYFWNKRTEDGFAKAITMFRRSIEIDPTYAPSYAGLADCYELLGSAPYSTLTPKEAFPQAEAAARKALELDGTLAEAYVPLGYSQLVYEWNFPEARKDFERALQLRPGYATAHQFYGYYLTAMGKSAEAIAERKKAVELDPISPLLNSALGEAYYHARRFDVTIEQNKKALELDPHYAIALVNIGRAYEQMGMHQQARDAFQTILTAAPEDPAILSLLGHEYAVSGDKVNANRTLAKLTEISTRKYVPALYFATVYIGLNRKDDAFYWLDKAYDERCEYLVYLGTEPMADPLRSDPRFSRLLGRIGLKPAIYQSAPRTP